MTIDLGQLLSLGFDGLNLEPDAARLLKQPMGGIILFSRNIDSLEQVVALNSEIINANPDAPPFIAVDQEGGRVARLRDICTPIPPMRQLGQLSLNHANISFKIGALMARELVALGFHLDFAPVLDVDSNPKNPIIGDRSFSSDPAAVASLGASFIRGMQSSGLAACAKHFPGHGDTDVDSHLDLPVINHDMKLLEQRELIPFRAAISAHVASIMTAHILMPKLDSTYPATLSPIIIEQLLRRDLGYEGVIFSDDLEMKALADRYDVREMVELGLIAGIDNFLICKDIEKTETALEALHHLYDTSPLLRDKMIAAHQRVVHMKQHYMGKASAPSLEDARQIVRCAPHLELMT